MLIREIQQNVTSFTNFTEYDLYTYEKETYIHSFCLFC